jgi:hypothetical protein
MRKERMKFWNFIRMHGEDEGERGEEEGDIKGHHLIFKNCSEEVYCWLVVDENKQNWIVNRKRIKLCWEFCLGMEDRGQ